MRRYKLSFLLALSLGFLASLTSCGTGKQRQPSRYLIPDGYIGWVRINYKIKDAPPVSIEDEHLFFKIPEDGLLNTSSVGEVGWVKDDDYYYYFDGKRRKISDTGKDRMIWGDVAFGSKTVPGQEPTMYQEFFVGSEEEFSKYGQALKDKELNPIIGNIKTMPALNNPLQSHQ